MQGKRDKMKGKISTSVFTPLFLGVTALALTLSGTGCIIDTSSSSGSCADNRYVTADWTIVRNSNNFPLSCTDAGASTVYMYFGDYTWSFPCYYGGSGGGTSPYSGLVEGSYLTSFQLTDSFGTILSQTPTTYYSVFHCTPTHVPTVTFGVN